TIRTDLMHPNESGKPGKANLLWTLEGLGALTPDDLVPAFDDPEPGLREQGLRLAERFVASSPAIRTSILKLAEDPSPRVRFQLVLSAGSLPPSDATVVLAKILERDAGDPWTVTAALSSSSQCAVPLIEKLAARK